MPTEHQIPIHANDNEADVVESGPLKKRGGRSSSFKAADLKRAVKTLQHAGVKPVRIEIETGGKIVIILTAEQRNTADSSLDDWMAKHARSA
jgi:hypothetical protein